MNGRRLNHRAATHMHGTSSVLDDLLSAKTSMIVVLTIVSASYSSNAAGASKFSSPRCDGRSMVLSI